MICHDNDHPSGVLSDQDHPVLPGHMIHGDLQFLSWKIGRHMRVSTTGGGQIIRWFFSIINRPFWSTCTTIYTHWWKPPYLGEVWRLFWRWGDPDTWPTISQLGLGVEFFYNDLAILGGESTNLPKGFVMMILWSICMAYQIAIRCYFYHGRSESSIHGWISTQ